MSRTHPVGAAPVPGRDDGDVHGADLRRCAEAVAASGDFFARARPVHVGRAPGRLDVMGGIADYSGAMVLELPLAAATLVAVQEADDAAITVRSPAAAEFGGDAEVTVPLDVLAPGGAVPDYDTARALLAGSERRRWGAYVVGTLIVLAREKGVPLDRGLRVLVESSVPTGKGVSSSAALEVATMRAVADVLDTPLEGRELALLCQRVENLVVGAPCGVMDQMTAACGREDELLALLCQPAELRGHAPLPEGVEVWGIDSGVRHEVGGSDYGAVRVGAFMGYRVVADLMGFDVREVSEGRVAVEDPEWHGYLANVPPSVWESELRDRVPEKMDGATFLARYGGTTDAVTRVDPGASYAVRQPTAHPVHEHARVRLFRALLDAPHLTEEVRALLGELMYQSHASYSACGLGSSGTDRLVDLVRSAGPAAGLYGAKITGGGSGGVVAVLARAGARDSVDEIARAYAAETGRAARVLGGSSSGAMSFGVVRLDPGAP
ncbi:galactokinase [Geodermatophilus sp. SYSU D00742]